MSEEQEKLRYANSILKRLHRRMQQRATYILQRVSKKKLPPTPYMRVANAYNQAAHMLLEEIEVLERNETKTSRS
jgi:hypothetical protein